MRRRRRWAIEDLERRSLLSGWSDTLTTDQATYALGQAIHFTFTRTNTGDAPASFEVDFSGVGFEVTQDGQEIPTSPPSATTPLATIVTLQPGQSWSIPGTWDGLDYAADYGPAGGESGVTITGSFVVTNRFDPAVSATFRIQPSPLTYSLAITHAGTQPGQASDFSDTITNASDQPVTFGLPPADFIVSGAGDDLGTVWESDPGASGQPSTSETLQPGQSLTETATWDGTANEGPLAGSVAFGDFDVSALGMPANVTSTLDIAGPIAATVTIAGGAINAYGEIADQPGQPLILTATETNTGDAPATVLVDDASFVLTLGATQASIPASGTATGGPVLTLQPGQSQTFTATWDPADDGTYDVRFQDDFTAADGPAIVVGTPAPPATATTSAGPIAMTVSASPTTSQAGGPVRITLTLQDVSPQKATLAPFKGRAEITVLRGSSVVATSRKRLSLPGAATLRPGRSLHLSTDLVLRPSRRTGPGTYTVEVVDGGESAATTVEIGGA